MLHKYATVLAGVGSLLLLLNTVTRSGAAEATLAWNAAPDANIAGYRLHCGTTSRVYTQQIEVGNVTTTTVSNLVEGITYFFAVTDYNTASVESSPSNEVSYTVPQTAPTPTPTLTPAPTPTITPLPSPTPSPTPMPLKVISFSLLNAYTHQAIKTIYNGSTISLSTLPTRGLNIRANTSPAIVGSVILILSGPQYHKQIESYTPYDLWGDCGVWTPPLGYYTLTATPYPLHQGYGQAGTSLTIHFTVTK